MAERGEDDIPRDAKVVKTLLKSMNVDDYEPRVVHQFLELWYRYVVDVLTDAQSKVNFSFSQPPPREVLLELARNRNKIPLPKSIVGPGIPLPPEQDTLISPNYQLAIQKKRSQPIEETEDDDEGVDPTPTPTPTPTPNPNLSQDRRDLPQGTPQRVSFPLGAKRPR
ncbi:Transcription initiation factor TFIID subunit 9 [Forsythia ovata]|uniref:Transcription initiation factor TFIID subunit 9 n=1 Tax=Forsythia ovata TaxID=205694 RepID=A0ABD1TV14_9LAMI